MAIRFNPPPGWPAPPEGWFPPAGWLPDPSWPAPPAGWQFQIEVPDPAGPPPWMPGRPAAPGGGHLGGVLAAFLVPPFDPRQTVEPGVLWSARGQPLTGIGAGRYRLTATMLLIEKGILSTRAWQVPIAQVVDVDLRQSANQRARNVGDILVHVPRGHGVELVVLEDVPDPRAGVAALDATASSARLADQQRQHPHHPAGAAPTASAPPTPAGDVDPIDRLRRLGELRDAGIVTEAEFAAKKAEILSRW